MDRVDRRVQALPGGMRKGKGREVGRRAFVARVIQDVSEHLLCNSRVVPEFLVRLLWLRCGRKGTKKGLGEERGHGASQ
jgi:hypothetical protein